MLGYLLLISIITVLTYWHDKRRARAGGPRVPESTLHFLEFLGGWPIAYIAQQKATPQNDQTQLSSDFLDYCGALSIPFTRSNLSVAGASYLRHTISVRCSQ